MDELTELGKNAPLQVVGSQIDCSVEMGAVLDLHGDGTVQGSKF